MSIARQTAMAELDGQIAMVEEMQAASRNASSPEEINQQQIDTLKAQKKGLEAEEAEENVYTKAAQAATRAGNRVRSGASSTNKWLANVPTPGGIWVPFWILVFLFLILFPVNGHTRMMWFWLVLTNNAQLPTLGSVGHQTAGWDQLSNGGTTSNTNTSTQTTTTTNTNTTGGSNAKTGSVNIGTGTLPSNPISTGVDTGNIFNFLEFLNQ